MINWYQHITSIEHLQREALELRILVDKAKEICRLLDITVGRWYEKNRIENEMNNTKDVEGGK